MNINFTLVIQAVNFYVCYLVLRKFVCAPVVRLIEQERAYQQTLIGQIQTNRSLVFTMEDLKAKSWQEYQLEFAKKTPDVTHVYASNHGLELPNVLPPDINSEKNDEVAAQITALIVSKVNHVH